MIELFRSSSVMRKCTERAKVNQNRANEGIGEFWKATELKSFREAWKTSLGEVPMPPLFFLTIVTSSGQLWHNNPYFKLPQVLTTKIIVELH